MRRYWDISLVILVLGVVSCSSPPVGHVSPGVVTSLLASPTPPIRSEVTTNPEYSKYVWSVYRDDDLGYSFEFPSPCGLRVWNDTIQFGGTSYLEVAPAGGLDLEEYVAQLIHELDQNDGPYHPTRDDRLINHEPKAIILQALIAQHSSVFALFQRDDVVFKFWSRLSASCTIPEVGLANPDSFFHSVESFTFVR
jgi:hypothetical protein